jgi:CRP-like cAMP-binding protein
MTGADDIPRGFLGRLDPDDAARLRAALAVRDHRDGETILSQGDAATDVFFVLSGVAQVALHGADGRLVLLREMAEGDVFGEFAAIDGGARTADVVACGPVRVGRMTRAAFLALLASRPGLSLAMMRHLVAVIRALSERVDEQTTMQVPERLLRELLRLGRAGTPRGDAAVLSPAPTHASLAANIGTHREAVTKQLSALARRGLVVREGRALRLPSLKALAEEVEEAAASRF